MTTPSQTSLGSGRPAASGESGMALIIVILVLAVLGVLVTHLAVVTETAAREARVLAVRGAMRHAAESAAERAFWMLLVDRQLFQDRSLGTPQSRPDIPLEEQWKTDGHRRRLETAEGPVDVYLHDAVRGLRLPTAATGVDTFRAELMRLLPAESTEEATEAVDRFVDVLGDYLDDDGGANLKRYYGKETDDYAADGWPDLPRNGGLQLKEEVFWLDGLAEMLEATGLGSGATLDPDIFQTLEPPQNTNAVAGRQRRQQAAAKLGFFSTPPALLRRSLPPSLDDAQFAMVMQARQQWENTGEDITSTLPPELLTVLRQFFSFNESGVVTVLTEGVDPANGIRRRLRLTRDVRTNSWTRGGETPYMINWEAFSY